MTVLGALKAGVAAARSASRPVFAFASVADVALESGILADEILRAVLKEDYDPALRDLGEQVVDAGRRYDQQLSDALEAFEDMHSILDGIESLASLQLDYGDRAEVVLQYLDQLSELRQRLHSAAPVTYLWFDTIELRAKAELSLADVASRVGEMIENHGVNYAYIGLASAGLASTLGTRAWAHWKGAGPRPRAQALGESVDQPPRHQAGPDLAGAPTASTTLPLDKTKLTHLRSGLAVLRAPLRKAYDTLTRYPEAGRVATGLWTTTTFALGVHTLVQKRRSRSETVAALNGMLKSYERGTRHYAKLLHGTPDDDAPEQVVKTHVDDLVEFFELDRDALSPSAVDALGRGYLRIQKDYIEMLGSILVGMNETYYAMLSEFRPVATEGERATLDRLRDAQRGHIRAQSIALDSSRPPADRRAHGVHVAHKLFSDNVSAELNATLAELQQALSNHSAYRVVSMAATRLARKRRDVESDIEQQAAAMLAKLAQNGVTPTEDQRVDMLERLLRRSTDQFTASLKEEAKVVYSDLELFFNDRSRLETEASVMETLERMLEEYAGTADEVTRRWLESSRAQLSDLHRELATELSMIAQVAPPAADTAAVSDKRAHCASELARQTDAHLARFMTDFDVSLADRSLYTTQDELKKALSITAHF